MNVRGERIIVFGDSTSHHGSDNAPEIWDVDQGANRSSGQPGDLLASILKEQGAEAVRVNARVSRSAPNFFGREDAQGLFNSDAQFRPTKVVIILGTNDLHINRAIDEQAMRQIVGFYEGIGAEVWGVGPWMYANEQLNKDAEPVIEMQRQIFGGRFVDPRPITAVVGRSADGVHFGGEASRQTALGLADLLMSTKSPKNWMPLAVGAALVVGLGLIWSYWRQRNLPSHGRPLLGSSSLRGYRVWYGTSDAQGTFRIPVEHVFQTIDGATKHMRSVKRQGYWTWIEDEAGNFVPVTGAKRESVRKGYPLRDRDKTIKGLGKMLPPGATFIVEDAANAVAKSKRFGDHKVFVSDVYKEVKKAGVDISLEDFKRELVRMHHEGNIKLTRADLVAVMDPKKVSSSEIDANGTNFHFVTLEGLGAKKPKKDLTVEDVMPGYHAQRKVEDLIRDPDPSSMDVAEDFVEERGLKLSEIFMNKTDVGHLKRALNVNGSIELGPLNPADAPVTRVFWTIKPSVDEHGRPWSPSRGDIHAQVDWEILHNATLNNFEQSRLRLDGDMPRHASSPEILMKQITADGWAIARALKKAPKELSNDKLNEIVVEALYPKTEDVPANRLGHRWNIQRKPHLYGR